MSNDTISKDPRMQEEARRAASEAALPRPSYDPKTVAREEYDRRVDQRYAAAPFEHVYKSITELFQKTPKLEDIRVVMTETEFRQACAALMRGVNATNLRKAADEELEKSRALQTATIIAIEDRVGSETKVRECLPDVLHGYMRANVDLTPARTCLVHPDGCPDETDVPGIAIPLSGQGGGSALLQALFDAISKAKK